MPVLQSVLGLVALIPILIELYRRTEEDTNKDPSWMDADYTTWDDTVQKGANK